MSATELHRPSAARRGSAMLATSVLLLVVAGLSLLLVSSAQSSHKEVQSRLQSTKAFYVAEGGIDFVMSQLNSSAMWPIRATGRFPTVTGTTSLESDWITLGQNGGAFRIAAQYIDGSGTAVDVTDRTATPSFRAVEVRVTGRFGEARRTVRARIAFEVTAFKGAIVGDSPGIGTPSGSGKGLALDNGQIVFDPGNQYVYGGVKANSGIYAGASTTPLTTANASSLLTGFSDGTISPELYGTADEIPDYTDPGSAQQLFDFGRFKAAALAGAGAYYDGLTAFGNAVTAANAAGTPLEGIIYVHVDAAVEGKDPKFKPAGGINIRGTLVFDFTNAPDKFYKVFIVTPLNINPAPLPANFDPADPSTFTTGYPPTISPAKDPRGFKINSTTYEDFPVDADLPALMFDTGTVDIHDVTNVCGAIYGPSFIEIENKNAVLQYFNGIILGGAGIYLEGATGAGAAQVFVYDPMAVNELATFEQRAKSPVLSGYLIDE